MEGNSSIRVFDSYDDNYEKVYKQMSNDTVRILPSDPFEMGFDDWGSEFGFDDWGSEFGSGDDGCVSICNSMVFRSRYDVGICYGSQRNKEGNESCSKGNGGAPHDAMLFAISYLGVKDLLSVERVCRSLRNAVQNDVLLWRCIQIDSPLRERISDDVLLGLTNRAQGNLLCLSLVKCLRITDNGLKHVLESNPKLTKLNVSGCTRLSMDGIVSHLKAFKASSKSGIKYLRIGRRYDLTLDHFEELKSLLGVDNWMHPKAFKPRLYHYQPLSIPFDDDRNIDIEMCPRCNNLTIIYDCPTCKESTEICRACIICIKRCIKCGRCVNDSEYVETFCLDLLCLTCWCEEGHEEKTTYSKHMIFLQQETAYCIPLCG